ncbi:MAG: hypothetical protein ACRDJH_19705 [Thermomicrobiales bacterium]
MSVRKPRPVLTPLAEFPVDPVVAALPKADLHLHQEGKARVDRLVARRQGREAYDWCAWARRVLAETPPGMGRLGAVYVPDDALDLDGASDDDPDLFIARVADTLEEGAADGAVLIEVRFGITLAGSPPDFMPLFREAERRVQARYPRLRAEAVGFLHVADDPGLVAEAERWLEACLAAAREGLGGVDFRVDPYDTEADPALWGIAHRLAARAADAGLGVTVHAGEFSTANLAAALRTPGLRRLGHAVYAAADQALLAEIARRGVTVECSLSCNVILGAAPSYEDHPIRRFVDVGVPVTLNTDLPLHACTTIGREYAIAAALGFSPADLLGFTRNAVRASFASEARRTALLAELAVR